MHDQIQNISLLGDSDKKILHDAIDQFWATREFSHSKSMSIFSNKGETVRLGKYVAEHYSEPVSYYSRTIFTLAPLFLDLDFKIVPSSNGSLSLPHSFIECIDYYLGNIENLKLTNATPSLYLKDIIGA